MSGTSWNWFRRRGHRPQTGLSPQSFDDFAEAYDRRDEVTGGFVTDWLEGVLAGRTGDTAIDLGCGTGNVAAKLAEHYRLVRAVDISGPMIELARHKHRHPGISFEQGDICQVTGQYDLVVSIMTLHHVPEVLPTLERISELVAPGGLAVLVDAVGAAPRSRFLHNAWAVLTLGGDIRRAWKKFRVAIDKQWVDHLLSDRFLSPAEFEALYRHAFGDAVVQSRGGISTAVWQRPGQATTEGATPLVSSSH